MRIPGHEIIRLWEASLPGRKGTAAKAERPESPTSQPPESGDRIDLSRQAKEGVEPGYDAATFPDTRGDRVDAIAQRVQSGTYSATTDDIADGLVRAAIFDRLL